MKSEKEFIKAENKLRMASDARLLVDLIYLNYKHSNSKFININHIYETLHDVVNYTEDKEEKIKEYAFIYLRVDYGLDLNN